jgi:A/G-specific adenine glycosylase
MVAPVVPWHDSVDGYSWAVAELLLRRTNRVAASRAFTDLTAVFPNWGALARATEDGVAARVGWAGLRNQRSKQLVGLANAVVQEHGGELPSDLQALRALPGVGPYIADAIRLHVLEQPALPVDGGVQRVLRRVAGLPIPQATRGSTPYRDLPVAAARRAIIEKREAYELRAIHLGLLSISWSVCLKTSPRCRECPIQAHCAVGQQVASEA